MPWEHVGECGSSSEASEATTEVELGVAYLRVVGGSPPSGCELGVMQHEHELGTYPTVGLLWNGTRSEPPWEYIAHCSTLLERFDSAVDWHQLSRISPEGRGGKPNRSRTSRHLAPARNFGSRSSAAAEARRTLEWREVFVLAYLAFWIGFAIAVGLIAYEVLPHPSP